MFFEDLCSLQQSKAEGGWHGERAFSSPSSGVETGFQSHSEHPQDPGAQLLPFNYLQLPWILPSWFPV